MRAVALFTFLAVAGTLAGCGGTRERNHRGGTSGGDSGMPALDGGTGDGSANPGDDGMPDDGDVMPDFGANGFTCAQALTVKPANDTLYVDGTHSFPLDFHAYCGQVEVTSQTGFSVANTALGDFRGATFRSAPGQSGATQVLAVSGSARGSTNLTVTQVANIIAPGAPQDAPQQFGGPSDASRAPEWVYPAEGVLVPPNLSELEFQFSPKGGTLFELGFSDGGGGSGIDLRVYTPCKSVGSGCSFELDVPTWRFVSTLARGKTLTVTVRGTTGSGQAVGTSAARHISFSEEDVTGGIYYWAASSGGIYRYDFGLRGQRAENFYTKGQAGASFCVGCHAMSRDGTHFAAGLDFPGGTVKVLDVATMAQRYTIGSGGFGGIGGNGSSFESFTPDGSRVITNEGGSLTVRDGNTGAKLGSGLSGANMPDVSPEGARVAYAQPKGSGGCPLGLCGSNPGVSQAGLYVADFNGTSFSGATQLVAPPSDSSAGAFYPSFSPDGLFVVYNHAPYIGKPWPLDNNGQEQDPNNSYDNPAAEVWAVSASGGQPVNLTALNGSVGNSWPKTAPFIHHFGGAGIFWVTFSSRRGYGLHGGSNSQIWMAAVDTAKLTQGRSDAAYPPFWLPFQDASTGNHIAQWAEKVARLPCSPTRLNACPQGQVCSDDRCVPAM